MSPVVRLSHVVLNTTDAPGLAAFYADAIGFAVDALPGHDVVLRLGRTRIDLRQVDPATEPYPAGIGGQDPRFQHCAIVVPDMTAAMARLDACPGWTAISVAGPERLPPNTGGVVAFKFRDPDGHPLELLWIPGDGAVAARFDHTALSVCDVARSVAYYARGGWEVTARSLNAGPEQSRLDGIHEAEVEIVTLTRPSASGPHLELLGYRGARAGGTTAPARTAIEATCTVFLVAGPQPLPATTRDPDGHLLAFVRAGDRTIASPGDVSCAAS